MPIRTATLRHQLELNGARLHAAMLARVQSRGADQPPSPKEQTLLDERRALSEAHAKRQAQALLPRAKAPKVLKAPAPPKAPKAAKAPKPAKDHAKPAKDGKPAKPHLSRTELHEKKAQAIAAAKLAARKSAKT